MQKEGIRYQSQMLEGLKHKFVLYFTVAKLPLKKF